tara:strand:- start:57 stop:725 length:669 start_codon:yes stop_codon:yes gene_type:complete
MGKIYRVQLCDGGGGNQRWCMPDGLDVGDIVEYANPVSGNTGQTFYGLVGPRFITSINTNQASNDACTQLLESPQGTPVEINGTYMVNYLDFWDLQRNHIDHCPACCGKDNISSPSSWAVTPNQLTSYYSSDYGDLVFPATPPNIIRDRAFCFQSHNCPEESEEDETTTFTTLTPNKDKDIPDIIPNTDTTTSLDKKPLDKKPLQEAFIKRLQKLAGIKKRG